MPFVSRFPAPAPRQRFDRTAAALVLKALALLVVLVAVCAPRPSLADRLSSILIDANDGRVLQSDDADLQRYPASLTKMMTLYLTFEALDDGRVTLDQPLSVSARAAAQPPTKLGFRAGQMIPLETAVLGLVTKSANDAAMVLAENLAGTEENFALRMTGTAHALGMTQTVFRNASGLPDPDQVTTARDMSVLALALLHHYPHYYHYFSVKEFSYGGRPIANHNRLLGVCEGVDGIKTGYTRASGFNLVASAQRGDRRLIGVVLGAPSSQVRNAMMTDLFEQAYRGESNIQLASVGHYLGGSSAAAGSNLGDMVAGARRDVGYEPPASIVAHTPTSTKATKSRRATAAVAGNSKTCGSGRKSKACPVLAKATNKSTTAKKGAVQKASTKQLAAASAKQTKKPTVAKASASTKAKTKTASSTAKPQPVSRTKTAKASIAPPSPAVRVARR